MVITVRQYACQSSRATTNMSTCTNTSVCKYCGKSHAPRQCAAYGKLCRKWDGPNHFVSVCLGGVVWHAALPLVDLCTLSRVAIPAGYYSSVCRASEIAILGCKACTELDLVRRVSVDTVAEKDVLAEAKMRA